jgi:Zn-dependent peptidase ImmA (M78 family)
MNDRLRELEAERMAELVIKDMGLTELPICPFEIAQRKGIIVQPKDASQGGVSGFLMRVGDTFGICHASHIKVKGFIRFTVAHELGHYFLDGHAEHLFPNGDCVHASRSGFISADPYERQADQFATTLLMPAQLFKAWLRTAGEGFQAIQSLADTFVTSLTATAIRFAKYSDDPVAVIVSSKNKVDYCFMSKALEDVPRLKWLKKGSPVAPATVTYEFNNNDDNITLCRKAEGWSALDLWFDDAPDVEMKEDVVGLGSYGKTLTVLYTDQAIDGDDEESEEDEDNGFDRISGRSGCR